MAKIEEIEGIGPKIGEKLRAAKIGSVAALLKAGGTKKGRIEIAKATGIDDSKILEFVNRADLMRIKGVSTQYSDLLEAAGVDTVKELRNRKANNLAAKMKEVNDAKKLVRQVPTEKQVEAWVAHAKTLEPAVSH